MYLVSYIHKVYTYGNKFKLIHLTVTVDTLHLL